MRFCLLAIALIAASAAHTQLIIRRRKATDLVNQTPKGKLHNPYNDSQANIVSQGATLFRSYPCSGCHGGNAGGGMCPPLTTSDWIYGGDDDSLPRGSHHHGGSHAAHGPNHQGLG